jgi:3-isopropylmalate/(R)-2-methylmalate dehydratase small subunit
MADSHRIEGIAATIDIANLDTDQIMPKQFLHGIDKAGLSKGVLWDLRFDGDGRPRADFVLNRPEFADTRVLVTGPNFGCGSSREHAVWGLRQFGIRAVIAASFGEIFYSNAMNNGLLAVQLTEDEVAGLFEEATGADEPLRVAICIDAMTVDTPGSSRKFSLSARHRKMFIEGRDMIGMTLVHEQDIAFFSQRYWDKFPWLKDVARRTRQRLEWN